LHQVMVAAGIVPRKDQNADDDADILTPIGA
jgi:hypothetical protein